ncbi:uncharacterized protein LOC122508912 [Leptopilina heterotoma]|uniref:uncharacterized protein LOC122508912 n=1 Tax=Leptopilina heterotoma TaxID=63436 RepID=UPI001CA99B0C|nr:uncharacterized protein LOC122508912 [Leptopilina heterotoma]
MQQKLSLPDYSCDFCSNMITTSLTSTGTFMILFIDDADLNPPMQLQMIPQSYTVVHDDKNIQYKLAGIVHFKIPYIPSPRQSKRGKASVKKTVSNMQEFLTKNLRKSVDENDETPVGHYTAICLRQGNKWTEYNDQKLKENQRSSTFPCCPSMLIFQQLE